MKIIGHRGARGLAPENTIASLREALKYDVDEIEFDVRVSSDHIPLLHHDAIISSDTQQLVIKDHTLAELKVFKPDLTTLAEALEYIGTEARLLVEVKPDENTEPIIATVHTYTTTERRLHNLSIGSFSQKTLRALHVELPEVEMIVIERWSGLKATWRARQLSTKRLNMKHLWLWSGFLRSMHQRGFLIAPYTMNDPAKARKWAPYLYGVITDRPDLFQK